ncbi:hypothetical protein BDR05DRAFT_951257 [Suillus weaverae]|nr:hypothetical protein BDR05DRAFT_951257 [Suillus weaverae]
MAVGLHAHMQTFLPPGQGESILVASNTKPSFQRLGQDDSTVTKPPKKNLGGVCQKEDTLQMIEDDSIVQLAQGALDNERSFRTFGRQLEPSAWNKPSNRFPFKVKSNEWTTNLSRLETRQSVVAEQELFLLRCQTQTNEVRTQEVTHACMENMRTFSAAECSEVGHDHEEKHT